ncbi:MAG: hypothetical protein JW737_07525 [Acidobacteria bacterium]|nr:hypothetical protein [Acidobacteriota bacterium]
MKRFTMFLLVAGLIFTIPCLNADEQEEKRNNFGFQMMGGGSNHPLANGYFAWGLVFQLSHKIDLNFNYRLIMDIESGYPEYYDTVFTDIEDAVLEIDLKYYFIHFGEFRLFAMGGAHTNFNTLDPFVGGGLDWAPDENDYISLYLEYGLALRSEEDDLQYIGMGMTLTPWIIGF